MQIVLKSELLTGPNGSQPNPSTDSEGIGTLVKIVFSELIYKERG